MRSHGDRVSKATVYRTIKLLQEAGIITQALFDARLMGGRLEEIEALLAAAAATRLRPSAKLSELSAKLNDAREARDRMEAALEAQDTETAWAALGPYIERFDLTHDAAWIHARLLERAGQQKEALAYACLAARMDPLRDDTRDYAVRLREAIGAEGPKVDIDTQRARILEDIYPLDTGDAPLPETGPTVTVVVLDGDPLTLASVRHQTYGDVEVLETDDPNGALEAATGEYVAWIEGGCLWHPHHLSLLVGHVQAQEARAACSEAVRVRCEDGVVAASYLVHPPELDRDHLLARNLAPLSCVLHARDVSARFLDLEHRGWDFLVQLALELPTLSHTHLVSLEAPVVPPPEPPDPAGRRALQAVYRHHERVALFNTNARKLQAKALDEYGAAQAPVGLSNVVVVATDDLQAVQRSVEAVRAHTHVPYHLVLVADGGGEPMAEWFRALRADDDKATFKLNRRPAGRAKTLNQGLAASNSELVALVDAGTVVADGWLGRLQWWAGQAPQTGLVVPGETGEWGASRPAERLDGRCVLLTRGVLDRAGGFDITLRGHPLDDYLVRARVAGFEALVAEDVVVEGEPPDVAGATDRFEARWGFVPEPGAALPRVDDIYERERHFVHFGSEEGFRPDARPLVVLEAAPRNVLVVAPWDDEAAVAGLLRDLDGLQAEVAFWLRVEVNGGDATAARLEAIARREGLDPAKLPSLLLLDAHLAPEREAALYVTADAVYVDDVWPDADLQARRATDCGRPILRGVDELRAWI